MVQQLIKFNYLLIITHTQIVHFYWKNLNYLIADKLTTPPIVARITYQYNRPKVIICQLFASN